MDCNINGASLDKREFVTENDYYAIKYNSLEGLKCLITVIFCVSQTF